MKSTSRACRFERMPARSPGFSITGPGRRPDRHAELVGDDVGERRLAEPRRAVEQHVIERLAALRAAAIETCRFSRTRSWPM